MHLTEEPIYFADLLMIYFVYLIIFTDFASEFCVIG